LPTRIANYLPPIKRSFCTAKTACWGWGKPQPGEEDPELINAGKEYVTLLKAAAFSTTATPSP
jgi:3-oxoadipate CoA-transferase beta subunit